MRLCLLPLLVLAAVFSAAPARAQTGSEATTALQAWHCGYVVTPRDLWAIRCYDLALLATYDPTAEQTTTLVWDVPLWGPPMSDERAIELVHALLCARDVPCTVRIAAEDSAQATTLH